MAILLIAFREEKRREDHQDLSFRKKDSAKIAGRDAAGDLFLSMRLETCSIRVSHAFH